MPTHVVQIGRNRFVCGLFWQSLSRPRELHKEAVELGRRLKFDLMVLRKDNGSAQAAYANTAEGVRPGMASLGAAVARTVAAEGAHIDGRQQPAPNWLAALELPDGHWAYFAVRDENFLPTGDFAGTREEVIDRLTSDYALGGWNVVFGAESLRAQGFHNFHARTLEQFLQRGRGGSLLSRGSLQLESLNARRQRIVAAVAAVASVAVVGVTYVMFDQHRRAESQRALAAAMERARNAAAPVGPPPPHPWPAQALPADFGHQCAARFEHLAPGGWELDSYECTLVSATHAWRRGPSVVAHLLELLPEATVALDGNSAKHAEPLGAKPSGQDEPLLPPKKALNTVASALQAMGLKPQFAHVPPPAPPKSRPAPGSKPPPGPPDWQTYKLSVRTNGLPPWQIASTLDVPGVRLTKASFNGEDWSIEGVIYAK